MTTVAREEAPPEATTEAGRVRGVWSGSTAVFRGIPYAEAPVGPLRFARPVRREPWEGVLDATEFGPTPLRGNAGITLIPELSVPGDDTLSVNVWTPSLDPAAKLPVLVWIHGGGFISGSPASPWYEGDAFARDGVVLVTLSYRLGFTGFGWIDGAVQNRGVLDWICALEWVRDNITAFGGDPDKVTISGQSAGGAAVLTLLGAPAATGLFRAGYAMSAAVADPSLTNAASRSRHLAKLAAVSPDVHGFEEVSEARILELQPHITRPEMPHLLHEVHGLLRDGLMLGPIVDGDVVIGGTLAAVSRGPSARVPLVLGTTSGELLGAFGAHQSLARFATEMFFHSWVPRVASVRASSPMAGLTWSYSFDWHSDDPPFAGHCCDIPFAFDCLGAPGVDRVDGVSPPQPLASAVHGALVAFARGGSPGWETDEGEGPTHVFDYRG